MKEALVSAEIIDTLYKKKRISANWTTIVKEDLEPFYNSYYNLRSDKNSAIVRYSSTDSWKLVNPKLEIEKLKPNDKEQLSLMDALLDTDISLVAVTGPAGAGKTLVVLAAALDSLTKNEKSKILCSKYTETVKASKFFGAVPGNELEKMAPFLGSYELAFHKLLGDRNYLKTLQENHKLLFKPIEFMRGDSYDNTFMVVDEMQACNWHELKTIATRLGENSKLVIMADLKQKDVRRNEISGLEQMLMSSQFRYSSLTAHIKLVNNYRSSLSALIGKIDEEIGE